MTDDEVYWAPKCSPFVPESPAPRWERPAMFAFIIVIHGFIITLAIIQAIRT